ncbi:MAG: hypothetical protein V4719_24095 [Planctomycetota bacterium]
MVAFCIIAAALMQEPNAKVPSVEALKMCEAVYKLRQDNIAVLEQRIQDLKTEYAWNELSPKARERIEKPRRNRLLQAKKDRSPPWPRSSPLDAKVGDVFHLDSVITLDNPNKDFNNDWHRDRLMGPSSILALGSTKRPKTAPLDTRIVIEGLKKNEIPDKRYGEMVLTGLWIRIEDLAVDGTKCIRIRRWSYDAETRDLWPSFLADKEKADKKD